MCPHILLSSLIVVNAVMSVVNLYLFMRRR
jgi:hypothetical protein